jgi:hypothetical protein
MSTDVKVFNACNHVINGVKHTSSSCPVCNGKSYYKDIAFDISGKVVLCTGELKLQQEILKIMDDPKFGNKFHQNWGDLLITAKGPKLIGSKNTEAAKQKIKIIIYETMMYLKTVQMNNQTLFKNMSDEEIIDQVISITVSDYTQLGYQVSVVFSNRVGQIFSQQIVL